MEYRVLGKTGLKVSQLSFGASSLGGVFHDIDEGRAIDAVFTALDGGMNLIDVSPYYGHYKAETVLGKALRFMSTTLSFRPLCLEDFRKWWTRHCPHWWN